MGCRLLVGIAVLVSSVASWTHADERLSILQEDLAEKVSAMEALVNEMEEESDGWKLRSVMQKHAQIMEASAILVSELADAEIRERDACQKTEGRAQYVDGCNVSVDFHNSQLRVMLVLMQHIIRRQNIIMEKTGIFK